MSTDNGLWEQLLRSCRMCPRECGVDRLAGETGVCRMGPTACVARASLHMWEEPCISGVSGSGTVFFAGCSLGCVYCQNASISLGDTQNCGIPVPTEKLAAVFLRLQEMGASNINLVTAAHFAVQAAEAIREARRNGLRIPVVYNSSGYEMPQTLRLLEGLTDIYLTDMRYISEDLAQRYSKAQDYPARAKEALCEMVRQTGEPVFDRQGLLKSGVIVRVLLLPGHVREAKHIVDYLYDTYADKILISLLNQYTPMPAVRDDPLLHRRVTQREYDRLVRYALEKGIVNGYTQDRETASDSFIPCFDGEGVLDV